MILLLLSILCSSGIYIVFKLFAKFGINTFQAITINYFVAAAFGYWYAGDFSSAGNSWNEPWLIWAALIGVLFITLFYVMALTSQEFGVTVASIASKMSMLIPVIILIVIDPEEDADLYKVAGVATGMLAVFLASAKGGVKQTGGATVLLPATLFLGSGGLDFLLAFVQKSFLSSAIQYKQFVPVPFVFAAVVGTVILAIRSAKKRQQLEFKNFIAGIVLGLINYGSIYFVLRVIGSGIMDRSSAIPANNIGIVLLSALVGFLIFKERLSAKNVAGVVLAMASIALLTFRSFLT
jgi:drug/metabolite transporter (DMT)-like permease